MYIEEANEYESSRGSDGDKNLISSVGRGEKKSDIAIDEVESHQQILRRFLTGFGSVNRSIREI